MSVKAPAQIVDVRVENCGIFMFEPLTPEAKDWVAENVRLEGWQWLGRRFAVEGCDNAMSLTQGMLDAGLVVE